MKNLLLRSSGLTGSFHKIFKSCKASVNSSIFSRRVGIGALLQTSKASGLIREKVLQRCVCSIVVVGARVVSQRLATRHPHGGPALRYDHRLHFRVDLLWRVACHHRCKIKFAIYYLGK